ncbi:unnamed protein product [Boreogadus saida]
MKDALSPSVEAHPRAWRLAGVAPYLRGSGAGQQVVLEGNRMVLTCLAGGSWPLQYRWSLNNTFTSDWTPQYRSRSSAAPGQEPMRREEKGLVCWLPLPSVSRTMAGLYQCVVRNRMGTLLSKKTDVKVACGGRSV